MRLARPGATDCSWPPRVGVGFSPVAAVERQQLAQGFLVGDVCRPTVRGGHGRVKGCLWIGEPLRAGVVEVRQRALLKCLRRFLVTGNRGSGADRQEDW